jgi:hypothetical protein
MRLEVNGINSLLSAINPSNSWRRKDYYSIARESCPYCLKISSKIPRFFYAHMWAGLKTAYKQDRFSAFEGEE